MQGEGDSAFVGSNKLFPFSTVVFASWDYHLTDAAAARNLRHSIRNQLKEMVNDALLEDKIEDTKTRVKAYIWKVCKCFALNRATFILVVSKLPDQRVRQLYMMGMLVHP